MANNTLNYAEHGGDKWTVGGTLEVLAGATVIGLEPGGGGGGGVPPLRPATENTLGAVMAAEKAEGETVEIKIGADNKLYAPTYPVIPTMQNQANSTAKNAHELVRDFNALLAKLQAAGLMEH